MTRQGCLDCVCVCVCVCVCARARARSCVRACVPQVQMAPVLLFAQELPIVRRTGTHTTFRLAGWSVAVAAAAADELIALRASLHAFVQRAVGEPPTMAHRAATDALSRVFSEHAPVLPAGLAAEAEDEDEEEEEGEEGEEGSVRPGGGEAVAPTTDNEKAEPRVPMDVASTNAHEGRGRGELLPPDDWDDDGGDAEDA